jgi:hypothetical protein
MEADSFSKPSTRLHDVTSQKVTVLKITYQRTETIIMYDNNIKKQACVICPVEYA